MEQEQNIIPLPLEPLPEGSNDDRRLWIGNLDPRVREFTLLKLLQQYGAIEKFDLLFHRTGPLTGQPRGYAFITYSTIKDANRALKELHGKLVGTKHIAVRFAHSVPKSELERQKPEINIPALAGGKNKEIGGSSSVSKIQEIEAKLKRMQNMSDEFNLTATASGQSTSQKSSLVVPGLVLYKQPPKNQSKERSAPYRRHDGRRHRK